MNARTSLLFFSALGLAACDSSTPAADGGTDASTPTVDAATPAPDAGPPRDWPAMEPPSSTSPEDGITREVVTIDGVDAPPNPTTMDDTPAELNRVTVVRMHATGVTMPRAVVVAVPGFLGGAGSFEMLARHLVRRSIDASMPIEVWAVNRRSNLLEDRRGLDAAEVATDPDIARGYYFGGETVGGQGFDGFVTQDAVPFMSEWGLATLVGDLRAVIDRVPADLQRGHVFLMGHSLGGSFAETFAAWRFEDGTRGADLLAGVVLVDGHQSEMPISQDEYQNGFGSGLMTSPGTSAIRQTTRFVELPILGASVYAQAEIVAMDALYAPGDVREDRDRDQVLATLLSLRRSEIPMMTNAAAFGFAFDSESNGLSFAAVSCGTHAGGPVESYDSVFGPTLVHPSDPSATYTWIDALDATPAELTPEANLAHSWIDGRTNFGEWYFPARLPLDLAAVAGLAVTSDGFQASEGLRAFDGAAMDAPVLAIAAALTTVDSYQASRMRAAPIGDGRPLAGTARTDDAAYRVIDATFMTHIDPLSAADVPANPVPGAILDFVTANVTDGTVEPSFP